VARHPKKTVGWEARTCVLAPGALADPAEVVRLGERALADDPRNGDALWALGLAHYRAGHWDRAVKQAQEAIAADPETAWVRWPVLALAHHRLGHREEARRWLDRAAGWRRQAGEWGGFALGAEWPDFQVVYAEAAALIAGGKP
jgi:tetratricopeptide (TPR) repeat protein